MAISEEEFYKEFPLKASIQKILNKNAIVCDSSVSIKELRNTMITNDINSIPIIDKNKRLIDLKFLFEDKPINKNKVLNSMVIMVGGKEKD